MLYFSHSGYNYSQRRCERIVDWFVNRYLPRHKLSINVDHKGLLREGVFGWMWAADCDYRPRDFEIEIHNHMDEEHYTKTLLHELWHLYQHVKGALRDKHGKRLWKGIDHSETDYEDQPWERQAHHMEDVLYEEYLTNLSN